MELHKHCGSYSVSRLAEYENFLRDLERAVRRRHLASLGEVATRSAILNQDVVPKMHLELFPYAPVTTRSGWWRRIVARTWVCYWIPPRRVTWRRCRRWSTSWRATAPASAYTVLAAQKTGAEVCGHREEPAPGRIRP